MSVFIKVPGLVSYLSVTGVILRFMVLSVMSLSIYISVRTMVAVVSGCLALVFSSFLNIPTRSNWTVRRLYFMLICVLVREG